VNPNASINYQSIGSGGGIEQFLLQTVDFGSSERYLRDEDLAEAEEARGCEAIQIPVCSARSPSRSTTTSSTISSSRRRHRRHLRAPHHQLQRPGIAELNPDLDLPDQEIIPVHRSDGSGTTSVFTTYLENDTDTWTLGRAPRSSGPPAPSAARATRASPPASEQNPVGSATSTRPTPSNSDLPTAQVINATATPSRPRSRPPPRRSDRRDPRQLPVRHPRRRRRRATRSPAPTGSSPGSAATTRRPSPPEGLLDLGRRGGRRVRARARLRAALRGPQAPGARRHRAHQLRGVRSTA
jgi:hypothetical protein